MFDQVGGVVTPPGAVPAAAPDAAPEAPADAVEMARLCAWVARLAKAPTGALLARAVGGLEPGRLNGYALVDLVVAAARVVSWAQALLLGAVAEVAHCPEGGVGQPRVRTEGVDPHAREELAAALGCTPRGADALLEQAYQVVEALPAVGAALRAGRIDLLRARILATETAVVTDPDTRQVIVTEALATAGGLTPGQLTTRVRQRVLAAEPQAADQRQRRAVADRRVVGYLDPDGSATLAGYGLPPERAMAAEARIGALARTARRGGDPRPLAALRADVLLDLLLDEQTLPPTISDPTRSEMADSQPAGTAPAASAPTGHPRCGDSGPDWSHFPRWERDLAPEPEPEVGGPAHRPAPGGFPPTVLAGGSVNLHIGLTTLLGLDDLPADVTGWGPILAHTARTIAVRQHHTPWELLVYDDQGTLLDRTRLRRHPTAEQAAHVRARDVTCRAPGCPVPAQRAELDHTIAWSHGGGTTVGNLGALCSRHHHLKHEGGWHLRQDRPGRFTWTTRRGRTHTVTPEPPIPLPTPRPVATPARR